MNLLILAVLLAGCASSLEREGRCLASLTPSYLQAQDELLRLDSSWRAAARREVLAKAGGPSLVAGREPERAIARLEAGGGVAQSADRPTASEAYQRLAEAKVRHQPTLDWYQRVYGRVSLRTEEEEILSDTRLVLFTGPGAIFYPIVRWNLHSVLWDGADPDADTDPVTRYCADRLVSEQTIAVNRETLNARESAPPFNE